MNSNTGTYKMVDGVLVKVSDHPPKIGFATSTIAGRVTQPYWDEHLSSDPIYVTSTKQKHMLMKKQNLITKGPVHGGSPGL